MKFKLFLYTIGFACVLYAQEKKNILFIGSSLTYFNDMPQRLQSMLDENDAGFNIEQSTFAGTTLDGHLRTIVTGTDGDFTQTRPILENEISTTAQKIKEKNWDFIVVQAGPVSFLIEENRKLNLNPAMEKIKSLANKDCQFVLFYANADNNQELSFPLENCMPKAIVDRTLPNSPDNYKEKFCSKKINNSDEYYLELIRNYDEFAKENDLIKTTKIAKLFHTYKTLHPEINLFEDEIHPNNNGAFLTACVFYELFSHKKAVDLNYSRNLEKSTAEHIKTDVSNLD